MGDILATNHSLRKFSKVTRGLWVTGVTIWVLLFIINIALGRGIGDGDESAFAAGILAAPLFTWLFNLGVVLISLSIFSAFLRITAKAIIEGLGGNINASDDRLLEDGPLISPTAPPVGASNPLTSKDAQKEIRECQKNPYQWARKNLTPSQFEEWDDFGNPPLSKWISEGKPELRRWLRNR